LIFAEFFRNVRAVVISNSQMRLKYVFTYHHAQEQLVRATKYLRNHASLLGFGTDTHPTGDKCLRSWTYVGFINILWCRRKVRPFHLLHELNAWSG